MTTLNTVRKNLMADLKPTLPRRWKIIPYGTKIDELTAKQVVAMIILESVQRAPEAPQGALLVTFSLIVIDPATGPATREDALDDDLTEMLWAIDEVETLSWTSAQRTIFQNRVAYDITLAQYIEPIDKEA